MSKNKIQKIKLMMGYNPSKTLNENLLSNNIISEQKILRIAGEDLSSLKPAFEDAFKTVGSLEKVAIKDASGAVTTAKNYEELFDALKDGRTTESTLSQVYGQLLTSPKTPTKIIDGIIAHKDFESAFKKHYGQLINDEQALRTELNKKFGNNPQAVEKMIEKIKGEKTTPSVITAGEKTIIIHGNTGTININSTLGNLDKIAKENSAEVKEVEEIKDALDPTGQKVPKISDSIKKSITTILKKLSITSLWFLAKTGLVGLTLYGSYKLVKWYISNKLTAKNIDTTLPTCIQEIIGDEGVEITTQPNGDIVFKMTKTGVEEYDKVGGLFFYLDGTIKTVDGKRTGKYECNGDRLAINEIKNTYNHLSKYNRYVLSEQSTEITDSELNDIVKELDDQLSGDVFEGDSADMQDAYNALRAFVNKTYKGNNAISAIVNYYNEAYKADLLNDISTKLSPDDVLGIKAKENMISLVQASKITSSNRNTGIGNFKITWSDTKTADTRTTDSVKTDSEKSTQKITYKDCGYNFPMEYGCKSDKIEEIQVCLKLAVNGILDQNTWKAIGSQPLTIEKYEEILNNCGN